MGYRDFPQVDLVWGEQLVTTFLTRWRHLITRLIPIRREVFHIFITLEKSVIKFHPILIIREACQTQHSTTFPRFFVELFFCYEILVTAHAQRLITTCNQLSQLCRPVHGTHINASSKTLKVVNNLLHDFTPRLVSHVSSRDNENAYLGAIAQIFKC